MVSKPYYLSLTPQISYFPTSESGSVHAEIFIYKHKKSHLACSHSQKPSSSNGKRDRRWECVHSDKTLLTIIEGTQVPRNDIILLRQPDLRTEAGVQVGLQIVAHSSTVPVVNLCSLYSNFWRERERFFFLIYLSLVVPTCRKAYTCSCVHVQTQKRMFHCFGNIPQKVLHVLLHYVESFHQMDQQKMVQNYFK